MPRKTKYNDNFPTLAKGYAQKGLTDVQIAKNLRIGIRTFYEYQERYPQFAQSLKEGKAPVDFEVVNQLLKRALGYRYTEREQISLTSPAELKKAKDNNIEVKSVVVRQKVVEKEALPDVTAQIFWLKNRQPKDWRDKQEHELTGGLNITFEQFRDQLAEKRAKAEAESQQADDDEANE